MAWSTEEVEATVADYLDMLTLELNGQKYNKTVHRHKLLSRLNNRTEAAVELKHQNISAVLIELGCPYINGYKPRANYQNLLFEVVADRLKRNELFDMAALSAVQRPAAVPTPTDFSDISVEPPKLTAVREPRAPRIRTAVKRDYIDREARNASLGLAGEEFVVHYERWRLIKGGNERLANKVEHVAVSKGDGLGYDVLSFDVTGRERLIEVKTTSFGKETPFFITRNEVELSKSDSERFFLYRVFDFRNEPHLFSFRGAIERHCYLDPATYHARFS